MTPQRSVRPLRVEAGRRLVEEQHRRAVHERGGEVEPAAHAAAVGAHGTVGGVGRGRSARAARRRAARDRLGRQVRELPDHAEVLVAGQVLVDGGVLPREADALAHRLRVARSRRCRAPRPRPPSGCRIVVRMRTAVVLPAPLGPSRPSTVPVGTAKSTPSSATTVPKHFLQIFDDDRISHASSIFARSLNDVKYL